MDLHKNLTNIKFLNKKIQINIKKIKDFDVKKS